MPLALVTGAGVRVGRAIALALGCQGYDLILHAHSSLAAVESVAAELAALGRQATIIQADLAEAVGQDALGAAVTAKFQVLDLLVHNAGLYEQATLLQLTRAQYQRMMAVNLEAPLFVTQALLPLLQRAVQPSVVCISDASTHKPYSHYAHYMVSKAGVDMLVQTLALELAPHVRVNGVAPGTVAFPPDFPEAQRQAIVQRVPLKREGDPTDIAAAVAFLASSNARYVTGQILRVDGGWSVG